MFFCELNSIRLGEWTDQKFDLIWVDGAHGYPVLPIDLHNACRLINDGGLGTQLPKAAVSNQGSVIK